MTISTHKTPPNSLAAERSILGGILLDNESINSVLGILRAEDFFNASHQKIFSAMIDIFDAGEPCDLITLANTLQIKGELEDVGGEVYLSSLLDPPSPATNIATHCNIVKKKAIYRQLIAVGANIITQSYGELAINELLDATNKALFAICDKKLQPSFLPVKDILKDTIRYIEQQHKQKEHITGVPSGFIDLDDMTKGFQKGDLIIIAGRPSMGKTAFALNICQHAAIYARQKTGVAIFSMDMSKERLVTMLISSEGGIDGSRIRTGYLSENDWPQLTAGAARLHDAPIYIDDSPLMSVLEIRAKCNRLKAEKNIGMVIIDNLQLILGIRNSESGQMETHEALSSLKTLAKELDIPVIVLVRLPGKSENINIFDTGSILRELHESGTTVQDADVILVVHREAVYCEACMMRDGSCTIEGHDRSAEIIVAKQQPFGPTGSVSMVFYGDRCRFEDRKVEDEYRNENY